VGLNVRVFGEKLTNGGRLYEIFIAYPSSSIIEGRV
jgi:hypothetical protein